MLTTQRTCNVLWVGSGVTVRRIVSVDQPTADDVCLGCGREFWRCACHGGEGCLFEKQVSFKPGTGEAMASTLIAMAGFLDGIKTMLSPLARGQAETLLRRMDSFHLEGINDVGNGDGNGDGICAGAGQAEGARANGLDRSGSAEVPA